MDNKKIIITMMYIIFTIQKLAIIRFNTIIYSCLHSFFFYDTKLIFMKII